MIAIISLLLKKSLVVKRENTSIIPYSPKKIKIKFRLEYSTLNPLMSSLSPSAKSKGARLHSAKQVTHQAINRTPLGVQKIVGFFIERVVASTRGDNNMNANLISYLIVWAEARIPPNILNFDFVDTPTMRME